MSKPAPYGWAVMAPTGLSKEGGGGGMSVGIAVIAVKPENWEAAKKTYPYQYLNTHPEQPASVEKTKELAEQTWKKMTRETKNDYDWHPRH